MSYGMLPMYCRLLKWYFSLPCVYHMTQRIVTNHCPWRRNIPLVVSSPDISEHVLGSNFHNNGSGVPHILNSMVNVPHHMSASSSSIRKQLLNRLANKLCINSMMNKHVELHAYSRLRTRVSDHTHIGLQSHDIIYLIFFASSTTF